MSEQTQAGRAVNPRPQSHRFLPVLLVFLAGLLLGWLVIGWMLWPVQWVDASPANLQLDDQRQFVSLVAGEYAQTGDAALAQERLASWDEESLAKLLALMEHEASDETTQAALSDLREALSVPQTDFSFWDTILNQKWVVVSAALGGLVLLTAVALTIYPSIRRTQARQARRKQLEAEEEALLMAAAAPDNPVGTADRGADTAAASPQEQTRAEETAVEPQAPDNQPAQQEPQPTNPPPANAPADAAPTAPKRPQPEKPDPAANPNETPDAEKPNEQAPAPADPAPSQPASPLIDEEEEEEADGDIQSILSSVFEDDDDSAHFESLLKGLDDINMMKLVQLVERTAKQLRARHSREKTAVAPPAKTST